MAVFDDEIKGFICGDDLEVERQVSEIPAGTSVTQAWLTVKKSTTQADAQAVVQVAITATQGATGQIVDDGSVTGVADLLFVFTRAQSALMTKEYGFGIQIKLSDGRIYEPIHGVILGVARYTQATA